MRFIINYKVSTLFVFLHKPSIKSTVLSIYKGRIYAEVTNYKGLTCCSDRDSCNKIHSQLQTNGKVSTLFVFCINPSLEIVYQSHNIIIGSYAN